MASIITITGEQLFAAKAQANEQLDIDTFIFANVPGQDPNAPINRSEGIPTAYIVHQQMVQQVGRINENVVVYSTVLDSVTGPFEFNWVGLYSSVNDKLVAINHVPTVTKTITEPGTAGNTLNRNFGIEYSGIADLTGINVDAGTWQLDFTARLSGMDLLTQQLAADMNGKDWFIDDGLKVVPRTTANSFSVTPGVGYVSGLRVELKQEHILIVQSYPQFVYVDAWFSGNANSTWSPQLAFTVTNGEMDDYVDPSGAQHYVYKLAVINAADEVIDRRARSLLLESLSKTRIKTTVDEISKGKFIEGDLLTVIDRSNGDFKIVNSDSADGKGLLYAGPSLCAEIEFLDEISIVNLGCDEERDISEYIEYALSKANCYIPDPKDNYILEKGIVVPENKVVRFSSKKKHIITKNKDMSFMFDLSNSGSKFIGGGLNGNHPNYNGGGIVFNSGYDQVIEDTIITNTQISPIIYSESLSGHRSRISNSTLYASNRDEVYAVTYPENESNGDRILENINCNGGLLADYAGVSTLLVRGCNAIGCRYTGLSKKVSSTGNRWAGGTGNIDITLRGDDHSMTGDIVATNIILDYDAQNCYVASTAKEIIDNSNNKSSNKIYGVTMQDIVLWKASVDPQINNGNVKSILRKEGGIVNVSIAVDIGSNTTLGSGEWYFILPYNAKQSSVGVVLINNAGNFDTSSCCLLDKDTNIIKCFANGAGNGWNAGNPFQWKAGDSFYISITFVA